MDALLGVSGVSHSPHGRAGHDEPAWRRPWRMGIGVSTSPPFPHRRLGLRLVLMLAGPSTSSWASGSFDFAEPAESKTPWRGHRPPSAKIHSPSFSHTEAQKWLLVI